jgi:hypothetical protein
MAHRFLVATGAQRRAVLILERLEHRSLLSGSSVSVHSKNTPGIQDVAIEVPSTYVSEQASHLSVTLVRTTRSGHGHVKGPLTVNFSAALGSLPAGVQAMPGTAARQFTPINASVTFADSQSAANVDVPINSGVSNPGLVPVVLTVGSQSRLVDGGRTTVYLASGLNAIPPSIIKAHMVKRGIVVTFSKPMAPASVQNIHNYAVTYVPSQEFRLADLTGAGLIQRVNSGSSSISLKRAIYDPAANAVTLVPKVSLPLSGTYRISSPSSLSSRRPRPHKAQPLTDTEGNVLSASGAGGGAFSISISRGHPYVGTQPILWDGN